MSARRAVVGGGVEPRLRADERPRPGDKVSTYDQVLYSQHPEPILMRTPIAVSRGRLSVRVGVGLSAAFGFNVQPQGEFGTRLRGQGSHDRQSTS